MRISFILISIGALLALTIVASAQDKRDLLVRSDKENLSNDASWFYDDFETAQAESAKTNRPMMIVFR